MKNSAEPKDLADLLAALEPTADLAHRHAHVGHGAGAIGAAEEILHHRAAEHHAGAGPGALDEPRERQRGESGRHRAGE